MLVLSVASATSSIRHYCDYATHTVLVTSATSSSTSTTALVTENKRDYYGEDLIYRNDTLEMVLTDVGYVDARGNYHYYIHDYQGNVRQVVDAQGNVLEQNDYYPYGGLFGESASLQSYKYSGKELERMNGLNTYDFHARPYYYPVLQFHSPDILSEKTPWLSPYLYCAANPIMLIDPTGMEIRIIYPEENQNMDYVVYKNGILEPQKGSVIPLSEYVNNVRKDLDLLSQIPGEPSLRLSNLQESEQVLEIEKPQEIVIDKSINKAIAEDKIKRNNGEPTGSTIIYDPNSDVAMIKSDNSQKQRPAVVGLAHELLGHGWDYSLGLYLDSNIFKINGVSINEIRAINIENQVREYLKIPKRTSYGDQKIF